MSTPTITETRRHGAASPDRKPSARQIYCLAHLMADALGLDWPESRADASSMIQRLTNLPAATDQAREELAF